MYDNYEYANQRLAGTIVRLLDGTPIYVLGVERDFTVVYSSLANVGGDTRTAKLEGLNLTPVPLGFVNYNNNAYYMYRDPRREDWRQGLRRNNCVYKTIGRNPRSWDYTPNLPYRALKETILGNYPSFKSARDMINGGEVSSVAFSRKFSLNKYGELVYKNSYKIGTGLKLKDKFNFLQEELEIAAT